LPFIFCAAKAEHPIFNRVLLGHLLISEEIIFGNNRRFSKVFSEKPVISWIIRMTRILADGYT
jgi:hypothetical protein